MENLECDPVRIERGRCNSLRRTIRGESESATPVRIHCRGIANCRSQARATVGRLCQTPLLKWRLTEWSGGTPATQTESPKGELRGCERVKRPTIVVSTAVA